MKIGSYIHSVEDKLIHVIRQQLCPWRRFHQSDLQMWKLRLRWIEQGSCSHTSGPWRGGDIAIIYSSFLSWGRWIEDHWAYPVDGETVYAEHLQEISPGFNSPPALLWTTETYIFPALENEWNLPCTSKRSQGFQFFFFLPCAIIKSIEVWVFSSLLSLLSDILAPPLTGSSALHMLGCCERGRMVWEGGGHMAWLIFTALWHHSSKPCFPEGCRICLAAWLWAASQCPSGRTAGRHFLQIPASFVLLENVACWYSKEYYRTSCVMESLGMLPQLAFEFSVVLNTKCFSGVTPFFLFCISCLTCMA